MHLKSGLEKNPLTRILILVSFALLFSAPNAMAEMTVGGEFEFISPHAPDIKVAFGLKGYEESMARVFVDELRSQCAKLRCREELVDGKWVEQESRFHFPEGVWIQVSWDPNVVEIQTKPLTLSRARELQPLLQEVIFNTAYYAGLEPSAKRAGHFNFGVLSAFGGDPDLFLRFVIDYSNHPELAAGILREANMMTAPPMAALRVEQKDALRDVSRVDVSKMSIPELSQILLDDVFYMTVREQLTYEYAIHNQALGLKKVPEAKPGADTPMEVRAARSQQSFEEFLLLGELFQARIAYLKTLPKEKARHYNASSRVEFSTQEQVDRFYMYVTEAGLDWSRYRVLLPVGLRIRKVSDEVLNRGSVGASRCESAF